MAEKPDSGELSPTARMLLAAYNERLNDYLRVLEKNELDWRAAHDRMRNALDRNTSAMNDGFRQMHVKIDLHEDEDRKVERRVHDLEQAAGVITKRHLTFTGMISMVLGPFSTWLFKKLFGGG